MVAFPTESSGHRYFIPDGNGGYRESDALECARWSASPDWQRPFAEGGALVKREELPEYRAEVSTVFLGLDHSKGVGLPLVFETMVFGGWLDGYQVRYTTLREAETGHELAIRQVRKTPQEDQP